MLPELFDTRSDSAVTVAALMLSENFTVTFASALTPVAPATGSTDVTVGAIVSGPSTR